MFDRPIESWTEADLSALAGRRETARLEFKAQLNLDTPQHRKKAAKEVAALANAHGGHIIIGIEETQDGTGARVAGAIQPITDGAYPERLDDVILGNVSPRPTYRIEPIDVEGGICVAIEISTGSGPHMVDNGYPKRANYSITWMSESEVREAYRQSFRREVQADQAAARAAMRANEEAEEVESRLHDELSPQELAGFIQETGRELIPAWLSVIAFPDPPGSDLPSPLDYDHDSFRELPTSARLDRDHPLLFYITLERSQDGLRGELPRDWPYPSYLLHFWPNGVLEYGNLIFPSLTTGLPEDLRVPSLGLVHWIHDAITLFHDVYATIGYTGDVRLRVRLRNLEGYRLGLSHQYMQPGFEQDPRDVEVVTLAAGEMATQALSITRQMLDEVWLAAGLDPPCPFFDPTTGSLTAELAREFRELPE